MDSEFKGYAHPQVVVLGGDQVFFKVTYFLKCIPSDHDRWECHMAVKKNVFYDIPLHESFLFQKSRFPDAIGIKSSMLGKYHHQFSINIKYLKLLLQLLRQPQIVSVKEGDKFPTCSSDAIISGSGHSLIWYIEIPYIGKILFNANTISIFYFDPGILINLFTVQTNIRYLSLLQDSLLFSSRYRMIQ